MKLHAKFPTHLRAQDLEVEISGSFDPPLVDLKITFSKDGETVMVPDVTRDELAALMRQAANVARAKRFNS